MQKRKNTIISFLCIGCIFLLLAGCQKKFWEYDCVWVSESPYIYLPAENENVVIEVNGEKRDVVAVWSNDGEQIEFYDNKKNDILSDQNLIWVTDAEIKKGTLYLTIKTDNYGNCEGKAIVLEQEKTE